MKNDCYAINYLNKTKAVYSLIVPEAALMLLMSMSDVLLLSSAADTWATRS